MAVVLQFPVPAHAPPEPMGSRLPTSSERITTVTMTLSAADREALLAALEMALAVCAGNLGAARRMVQAYEPVDLGPQLDALADRVFALGRPSDNIVTRQRPDGCARCGGDRTDGNCSPLYEHLCADCAEADGWQTVIGSR